MVSGSDDFTLFLWNPTEDKKPLARLTGHQQPVNHLAFSPDGRRFASASFDKKIKVWDGRTGTFLATLNGHVGAVYQVAWSADSRLLVSASKDSTVKLWEMVALKRCVPLCLRLEDIRCRESYAEFAELLAVEAMRASFLSISHIHNITLG